ncbi:IS3 family transposase, partial [Salinibacter ruber]
MGRSRDTYGACRACAELRAEGLRIGKKRVHGLMKAACLKGVSRRKRPSTTARRAGGG